MCQDKFAKISYEYILTGVCNAVYFRLCIDLMHILPQVTAKGNDGSHYPRCAECRVPYYLLICLVVKSERKIQLSESVYEIPVKTNSTGPCRIPRHT